MKRQLSLKLSVSFAFLLLGIVLIIGYSVLSRHFFVLGMDSIVSANMEKSAETYLVTVADKERQHLNEFSGYHISRSWTQQPRVVQQIFNPRSQSQDQLYKHREGSWFGRPDKIYFMIELDINGERLFISKIATAADGSELVGRNIHESRKLLFILSIVITLSLLLVIGLLLRRISQPVSQLTHWTHHLTPEQLRQTPPDFSYPELNEMATIIQQSLSSVHDSLAREQKFLRFTSHELRTPISVVRNNVELIKKLQQTQKLDLPVKYSEIIERIDRASLTMQHLSETLLWLSRDNNENLAQQAFQLDCQIKQLVDEMTYLLNNKTVTVILKLSPYEITASQVASRIVLGNLIRNAFQHTWQGEVIIRQHAGQISIENHCEQFDSVNENSGEQGFGLGLQLTEQLCAKLHWHYQNTVQHDGHRVSLRL